MGTDEQEESCVSTHLLSSRQEVAATVKRVVEQERRLNEARVARIRLVAYSLVFFHRRGDEGAGQRLGARARREDPALRPGRGHRERLLQRALTARERLTRRSALGFWSKWFPSKEERMEQARQALREGRYEEARGLVARVEGDEADALYDEASEKMGVVAPEPEPPSVGISRRFVCWELQVVTADPNLRRGFLKLVVNELASAGINLDKREISSEALEEAVQRAQRSFRADHPDDPRYVGMVKVTPL